MNDTDFVTFEEAKALKDLGFNEPCFRLFLTNGQLLESEYKNRADFNADDDYISCPLKTQALRFFRENFGLFGYVWFNATKQFSVTIKVVIRDMVRDIYDWRLTFDTHERCRISVN